MKVEITYSSPSILVGKQTIWLDEIACLELGKKITLAVEAILQEYGGVLNGQVIDGSRKERDSR